MKIHQLPPGARFEYEGEEYVKTGPLSGTGKAGQRFIPRYAVLKAIGDVEMTAKMKSDSVSRPVVLKAFEAFYSDAKALVPNDKQMAMDAARTRFLNLLD